MGLVGWIRINQRNSEFDSPYKFSAKELDSEIEPLGEDSRTPLNNNLCEQSGYNYFGARYYDSELSNWLSVDPLADERSWVSPYSYVQNSPVMRVDPSGALDNLHEYSVNKKGDVKKEKHVEGSTEDHLHTKENWDEGKHDQSVTINDQKILADLEVGNKKDGLSIARDYSEGSIDDLFKVFKFAADYSDAEWAIARYNNDKYAVWTNNNLGNNTRQNVDHPAKIGINNVNASMHSHPNTSLGSERSSMGLGKRGGYNPWSDWGNKIKGHRPYHMYVYFPDSKNIYNITKPRINKIGNIKSYRSFYFGALNHR